jgi:hypothetical protein
MRGAAGRPRRLSLAFLKQERHKLEAYRWAGGNAACWFPPKLCLDFSCLFVSTRTLSVSLCVSVSLVVCLSQQRNQEQHKLEAYR